MDLKTLSLNDVALDKCDVKFAETEGVFSGYGNVFNVLDSKNDIVMPGAFAKIIKSGNPADLYVNHGWLRGELPIGRWTDLEEDPYGLFGDSSIVMKMTSGNDAYHALKNKLVKGLSIAARPSRNGVEMNTKGHRLIHEYEVLKEISIVNTPANGLSEVTSIKFDDEIKSLQTIKEFEHYLREAGNFSRDHAKMLVSQIKGILDQRDADGIALDQKSIDALADRISLFKVPG